MFDSDQPGNGEIGAIPTQPELPIARLMRVIADPTLHPGRLVAFEVVLRVVEIAAVAALVLWVLPVIADTAG